MSPETTLSRSTCAGSLARLCNAGKQAPDMLWLDLHRRDDAAVASQSPEWAGAVAAAGGFRSCPQSYDFSDGSRAVLPLFTKGLGRRRYAWSPPPAWGFGGVLADSAMTPAKLRAILAHLETLPYFGIKIRPNPLAADLWAAAVRPGWAAIPRLAHVLDLSVGLDAVRGRFRSSAGTNIRRAQKRGVEVETGNSHRLIDEFHGLLQLSFKRWARMQHEPLVKCIMGFHDAF